MFGHGVHCVILHIADRDALLLAGLQVDVVGARGSHCNQLESRRPSQRLHTQLDLVDDDNIRIFDASGHVIHTCTRVFHPLVRERQRAQACFCRKGVAVKEDDFHDRHQAQSAVILAPWMTRPQ